MNIEEDDMEGKSNNSVQTLKAHLALNVRNVATSIEFYRKLLGIEPSKVRVGYAKFDVQNPPLNLTLNQRQFGERGALSHLGIQVGSTEDVLSMRQKWANAGLVTRDEMQTNCCYARQDKTWVHDPDGNEWEAFVVLEDNLAETSACCGIETEVSQATTSITKAEASTTSALEAVTCCAGSTSSSAVASE
jgi:catechol 2,3-dioxygenase-like lactoylglutathione lyase family enzyme